MKLYVASSWRNIIYSDVISTLKKAGFDCYDFQNPAPGDKGFHWEEIDPDWMEWDPVSFKEGLRSEIARDGFNKDMSAMIWADACVLVLPSGRSSHLEAGWFVGKRKPLIIYMSDEMDHEPELMYRMATAICTNETELVETLNQIQDKTYVLNFI